MLVLTRGGKEEVISSTKILLISLCLFFPMDTFSRVYLPNEKFFSQAECEPRTLCGVLKDYIITEPPIIRGVLNKYKRLKMEKKIIDQSSNLSLLFNFSSQYTASRNGSYWTFNDGVAFKNEFGLNDWTNNWSINGMWQPFNLSSVPQRKDFVENELKTYFYLARLSIFKTINTFVALRSPDNIFGVIRGARVLDLINFTLPKIQKFFKKEMFLYKQKLVSMEKVLYLYDQYNFILSKKVKEFNNIHYYEPSYYRLKNMVLNSIDAIFLELLDYVESHVSLESYRVCTKKAYLEESVKKTVYNLRLGFESSGRNFQNNMSGFTFALGGELNEPMNLQSTISYGFTYNILELDSQKLAKWDYIVQRKNISDDFVKLVELEENFLKETFLLSKAYLENYLQSKENREQVYLILKGKIINRLGDKNFKFGFTTFEEKTANLLRVLSVEVSHRQNLVQYANTLFIGLSQCALSEKIVEEVQHL